MSERPSRRGAKPNIIWTIKVKSDRRARGQTYFNLLSAFQTAEAAVTHPIPVDAQAVMLSEASLSSYQTFSGTARSVAHVGGLDQKMLSVAIPFTYYIHFLYSISIFALAGLFLQELLQQSTKQHIQPTVYCLLLKHFVGLSTCSQGDFCVLCDIKKGKRIQEWTSHFQANFASHQAFKASFQLFVIFLTKHIFINRMETICNRGGSRQGKVWDASKTQSVVNFPQENASLLLCVFTDFTQPLIFIH